MRRRGIGTYLLQTGAALLEPRGVKAIRATTLPDNDSFIGMAQALGGEVVHRPDLVEVSFDVAALAQAYRRRRAARGAPPASEWPASALDRGGRFAHKAAHDEPPHHRDLHSPLTSRRGALPVSKSGPT